MAEDTNKTDDGDSGGGGLDRLLGTISPLYGLATGSGLFGGLAGSKMMGLVPALMAKKKKKPGEPEKPGAAPAASPPGMARGGKVNMSKGKSMGAPVVKKPKALARAKKGMASPIGKPKMKFAKGGSVRGDGCCSRGRTKGRMR